MSVEELATALLARLVEVYEDQPAMKIVLQPGQTTTADWCWGGCGTVYVRLDTAHPSPEFPNPATRPDVCLAPTAVRFHIGVHRCIAGPDSKGTPPPPEEQAADAFTIMDDAGRIRRAVVCADWFSAKETVLGGWTPLGPFGDCAGGYWPVTFRSRSPWPQG